MNDVPQVYIPLRRALTPEEMSPETDVMSMLLLRAIAVVVDWLLLSVLIFVPVAYLGGTPLQALVGAVAAGAIVYFPVCEAVWGRTLGKRLTGLHVIDRTAHPPSLLRTSVRSLFGVVESSPILLGAPAAFAILLTPKRQRIGDLVTGVYVVSGTDLSRIQQAHAVEFTT